MSTLSFGFLLGVGIFAAVILLISSFVLLCGVVAYWMNWTTARKRQKVRAARLAPTGW